MAKQKFTVVRQHFGDKDYWPGDEREADPATVSHLVQSGVLRLKAEKPVGNKAVTPPSNKAAQNAEKS